LLSKYKPEHRIIACSFKSHAINYMQCLRGVEPIQLSPIDEDKSEDEILNIMLRKALDKKLVNAGSNVIFIQGIDEEGEKEASQVRIIKAH